MATIVKKSDAFKYDFVFTRGNSTATRSFTFDTKSLSTALPEAQSLQSILSGSISSPFEVLDATALFQPAGWRDDDPNEAPWDTKQVNLTGVHTDEYIFGGSTTTVEFDFDYDTPEDGLFVDVQNAPNITVDNVKAFNEKGQSLTLNTVGSTTGYFLIPAAQINDSKIISVTAYYNGTITNAQFTI